MVSTALRSNLLKTVGIYTLSTAMNAAIPFFMLPVLTRYLTPEDYGTIAMFFVVLGVVAPFVNLGIPGVVSVKYFEKDKVRFPEFLGNCILILLASTAAVSFLLWLLAGPIEALAAIPRTWLWAVVFLAAGQCIILMVMTIWQMQNKPFHYGVYQNLQTLMILGIALVLIVGLNRDWQGRIEAEIASSVLFASLGIMILYRNGWLAFRPNRQYAKQILGFGIPLIPHALGGMIIIQTDRLFITNMAGLSDTGVYTVGFQIAAVIEMAAVSFNRAYVPWLFEQLHRDDMSVKKRIVKYTYLYFGIILVAAAAVSLIAPGLLQLLVGREFVGAYRYVGWISLGFAFSGMYYMVANYIFFANATRTLAMITFLTAMVNIALNYVLIRHNGPVGAAQASAAAFFMSFVLTWIASAKAYDMPWTLRKATPA